MGVPGRYEAEGVAPNEIRVCAGKDVAARVVPTQPPIFQAGEYVVARNESLSLQDVGSDAVGSTPAPPQRFALHKILREFPEMFRAIFGHSSCAEIRRVSRGGRW